MNQSTHAWLAVEACKKLGRYAGTAAGKKAKAAGLAELLGADIGNVVIAAWLPDSLVKDMAYGHVFKNATYDGDQKKRFTLAPAALAGFLGKGSKVAELAFPLVPGPWWKKPYRVKPEGGHLPARVSSLCQTARDMFKMGDPDVTAITGVKAKGSEPVDASLLFTPRNIATVLWMLSHYVADAHMPFHCDDRALASSKHKAHGAIEDAWGEQVPALFKAASILAASRAEIEGAALPAGSRFAGIELGDEVAALGGEGDPWKAAVYICRASFAASFALVPEALAPVGDQAYAPSFKEILSADVCGEERFWELSRAIMTDAIEAIAAFWLDAWRGFVKGE